MVVPQLAPRFQMTHEMLSYPLRLAGFCQAWAEGCRDGRWLSGFASGYGYPFFNFYPPGFFYAGLAFHKLGFSYAAAIKGAVIGFSLLGSAGAYRLGRDFWRSPSAGAVTAVLWTFLPYRVLDLYVRGDLAELSAISLMPWALLGYWRLAGGGGRSALLLAACAQGAIGGLHNISFLLFQGFLAAFVLLALLVARRWDWRRGLRLAGANALALGLGCAWWLPAFVEKQSVHIHRVILPDSDFVAGNNLIPLGDLLVRPWKVLTGAADEVPFYPGACALVAGAALAALACGRLHKAGWPEPRRRFLLLGALALPALALTLGPSGWFWRHAPLMGYVQFPWRLLMFSGQVLALMAGASGYLIEHWTPRRRADCLGLVALGLALCVMMTYHPQWGERVADKDIDRKIAREYVTTAIMNEYLPRAASLDESRWIGARPLGGALTVGETVLAPEPPGAGGRFTVRLDRAGTLTWHHHFFPGWRATVDGREVGISVSPRGLIQVAAPAGEHRVAFSFHDTPLRRAAKGISLVAAGLALAAAFWPRPRKKSLPRRMPPDEADVVEREFAASRREETLTSVAGGPPGRQSRGPD
jgi:hypothetical protein